MDGGATRRDAPAMLNDTHTAAPVVTRAGEGDARWWFGALAEIKLATPEVSIIEVTEPPHAEAPLHVHHREDEGFWLLEGSATFVVGDLTVDARAGDYLFGPRDVPHRYTTGPDGCRMLFVMTPGGFEDLVREMSVPAERRTLPPPMDAEPDWAQVAEVGRRHGCELLG